MKLPGSEVAPLEHEADRVHHRARAGAVRALEREVGGDQDVRLSAARDELAADGCRQGARRRAARRADPRRAGAGRQRLRGADRDRRGDRVRARVDARRPCRRRSWPPRPRPRRRRRRSTPAPTSIVRVTGFGPGLDPPDHALLLGRHPDRAAAHRDRRRRLRRRTGSSGRLGWCADRSRRRPGLVEEPHALSPAAIRPASTSIVATSRPVVGVDPRDGAVGVARPHRARAHRDVGIAPVERGDRGLARPVGQLDRVRDRARLGVETRDADREVAGLAAAVADPERALAGGDVGRHAARLEPPGDGLASSGRCARRSRSRCSGPRPRPRRRRCCSAPWRTR